MIAFISPIRENVAAITDDDIRDLLAKNAPRAHEMAQKKIDEVYQKIGFRL
jgi:hypothetical protein